MSTLLLDNDQPITITVKDKDGNASSTAVVDIILKDKNGTPVVGETWPVTVAHVSGGNYVYDKQDTLTLVAKETYTLEITIVDSGINAFCTAALSAAERVITAT